MRKTKKHWLHLGNVLCVLLHAFIFIVITCKTNYKLKLEKYCFLNIHTKKIKFAVKLILFYMNINMLLYYIKNFKNPMGTEP